MAESICRVLRDGALEGEHAPALTIKDSLDSPFAFDVFSYILVQLSSQILRGKSQARGIVIVAVSWSPSSYIAFLKTKGVDIESSQKCIRILDCYTDPLGWKDKIWKSRNIKDITYQGALISSSYKAMKDLEKLFSVIIELGGGLVGEKKAHICVAIDSLSELLRLTTSQSVSSFLSNLRSHDQISCIFGLLHPDLHDDRVAAVLDYMSSMVANVEPFHHSLNGLRGNSESSLSEQSFTRGKFNVRFKRRNGRVRVMCEEFKVEPEGISFTSVSSVDRMTISALLPKVQFNLELSEKERTDRANVVLPFEHQGNGRPIQIYDGRRSLEDYNIEAKDTSSGKKGCSGMGEIIYYRDSDDEMPDSDEDPDDDLDI
ncbi:elongator complex protein 5 [Prosopis cineraria]|uniref:elongator complex protein 5 n=1 Tax=Prosopis cineraria TaxID=364024 RepID=UPI002410583E|nr:elongator complex protein 5 [Prosopis cineraria]XP_054810396.1 elongator complex protein 5 [Prosopis cineraria]XP_054810397.1 elongator complex protein 5 [Prosopis cineraria]